MTLSSNQIFKFNNFRSSLLPRERSNYEQLYYYLSINFRHFFDSNSIIILQNLHRKLQKEKFNCTKSHVASS